MSGATVADLEAARAAVGCACLAAIKDYCPRCRRVAALVAAARGSADAPYCHRCLSRHWGESRGPAGYCPAPVFPEPPAGGHDPGHDRQEADDRAPDR